MALKFIMMDHSTLELVIPWNGQWGMGEWADVGAAQGGKVQGGWQNECCI